MHALLSHGPTDLKRDIHTHTLCIHQYGDGDCVHNKTYLNNSSAGATYAVEQCQHAVISRGAGDLHYIVQQGTLADEEGGRETR